MQMDHIRNKLRKHWEKNLPPIDDEWNYWWLFAENYCLGVIPGTNMLAALDLIEDHHEKYSSIKASTAKIIDHDLLRKNTPVIEVSNREHNHSIAAGTTG